MDLGDRAACRSSYRFNVARHLAAPAGVWCIPGLTLQSSWMNGLWCGHSPVARGAQRRYGIRYEILGNGHVREMRFRGSNRDSDASIEKATHIVERSSGLFVKRPTVYPWRRHNGRKIKDPYRESAIRKEGENQFSNVWSRTVYHQGPRQKRKSSLRYHRCETG